MNRAPSTDAELIQWIDTYLQLNEDREMDAASAYLAPGAQLVFPGNVVYNSLAELVQGAKGRYQWVRKHRDRYFVGRDGDAVTITSLGRLYGVDLSGNEFHDIRYVDVFVLEDGLIKEQIVWNDMADLGITAPVNA